MVRLPTVESLPPLKLAPREIKVERRRSPGSHKPPCRVDVDGARDIDRVRLPVVIACWMAASNSGLVRDINRRGRRAGHAEHQRARRKGGRDTSQNRRREPKGDWGKPAACTFRAMPCGS